MVKLPLKDRFVWSGAVLALVGLLVVLGILQYHWSKQVSVAASARLQTNLETSMMSWRENLYRELASVYQVLQADASASSEDRLQQYAQEYQAWSRTTAHPTLVARVFLLESAGTSGARLYQLNLPTNQFKPADWPAGFEQMHDWLQSMSQGLTRMMERFDSRNDTHRKSGEPGRGPSRRLFNPDASPLMIDLKLMTLVRGQVRHPAANARGDRASGAAMDVLIVQLDRKVLQQHILPELAEQHFGGTRGLEYQVAVISRAEQPEVVYTSDAGFGRQATNGADGNVVVFGPPHGPGAGGRGPNLMFGPGLHHQGGPGASQHQGGPGQRPPADFGLSGVLRIDPMHYPDQDSNWQLVVRHRQGSLEAVVAGIQRRNLAISFGVLLVLAAAMGLIVISSQRARKLAQLQMDFVAAVSHELRTPLAVISSAAENIADGVVAGKEQVAQYGTLIKDQSRQLIQLVEQILLFAAAREDRYRYNMRPLKVAELIDAALANTAGSATAAGVTVEQEIAPDLPPVSGDLGALVHCLQNLITNAIKYGGDARWLRVRARAEGRAGQRREVQISVEDKGLGISAADLPHIFEPFYRSPSATDAQIHGTGLGLPLAREIAQAMGGRLTVESHPGKGSCFTLFLLSADEVKSQAGVQATTEPGLSKT